LQFSALNVPVFIGQAVVGQAAFQVEAAGSQQHGGGKQDMLLLLAECLEFGQLQQGFTHHFSMDVHIAFSVPFRILRHVFHVGKPTEAVFQGLPVGKFAGCVMRECPHGRLSYYWMT